ncbi:protein FAR1-RELATED SEQUENCE 5-like [Silene latifolia]|uniref:protein FAR1-RELATED SEQUENCE 5-like n=1 Tax=Silene latifolia TaxID=37657 RepID=UPI003D782593
MELVEASSSWPYRQLKAGPGEPFDWLSWGWISGCCLDLVCGLVRTIIELNAAQFALALEVEIPEVVTSEFIQEKEEVEETEASSSNTNRIFEYPIHLKPNIGMVFPTLQLGIEFYGSYAKECGFVTGLGSQKDSKGVITHKECLCNKAGDCEAKGTQQRRQRTRIGYSALIKFRRIDKGQYEIYDFDEGHNHMPQTPLTMVHLTQLRELNIIHKKLIADNSKLNLGPVKSFRILKEYVRGYKNVGVSLEDFKKNSRDIKKYLSEGDPQMLIEHFMKGEYVEPHEFEESWTRIVEFHGLPENGWLKEKYGIRQMWILAYFRDLFLVGLMRTTSRSESENHFFSNFTNPNLTLVEFWMRFESAMDVQRWTQSKLIAQ